MAIKAKGEIAITLGKKSLKLTPSIEAILEVEEQAGVGITSLLEQFRSANIGLRNMTALIYGGLVGSGDIFEGKKKLTFKEVAGKIKTQGIHSLIKPCTDFLIQCVTGDSEETNPKEEES